MNILKLLLIASAVVVGLSFQVEAQEQRLQSVVVTGSMINNNRNHTTPAISITRQADFVLFGMTFVNGSVSQNERRSQQAKMFANVVKTASETEGLTLLVGDEDEHAPIQTVTFDEAYGYDGELSFMLKLQTKDDDNFDRVRARAEKFIKSVGTTGRSDVMFDDEQLLGLDDSRRYRMELLTYISKDADTLAEMFSANRVKIEGLHLPLVTRPVGPLELEIFIPYSMTLKKHD